MAFPIAIPNPTLLIIGKSFVLSPKYITWLRLIFKLEHSFSNALNFLDDGTFYAGVTSPGIRLAAAALWGGTAKLPEVEIKKVDTIMGRDTVSSMQAGIYYGYIGQTEYIVNRLKKESGLENIKVVATGGLGKLISESTDCIDVYDPELTLHGLRLIYDKQ